MSASAGSAAGGPRQPAGSDVVLERLLALHPKVIDLSLDRVERLLAALDHPEQGLPPVLHVAGTNGKGSLLAFLRAMLEAAGYRVHLYTSPHLVRFHERIRLAGRLIEEDHLQALLEEAERANAGHPITFFEITTAAAFLAFARTPADVLLLETGLGGRLDATNVVARPRLTAITPVSVDHVQFLGDSLAGIAWEKAGILKPGVPAVVARQPAEALPVIETRAADVEAPLVRAGAEWDYAADAAAAGFVYRGRAGEARYPAPRLLGPYQIANAAMAVACAEALEGFTVDDDAVRRGLATAEWPGRLQRLTRGPLAQALPPGWELWLDGGHNADAGRALAGAIDAWAAEAAGHNAGPPRPLHLVFGMLNTKDPRAFLAPLAPRTDSLTAIAVPGEAASLTAAEAAAEAHAIGARRVGEADSVADALAALAAQAPADVPPARVLICGSLYLAGRVLAENG